MTQRSRVAAIAFLVCAFACAALSRYLIGNAPACGISPLVPGTLRVVQFCGDTGARLGALLVTAAALMTALLSAIDLRRRYAGVLFAVAAVAMTLFPYVETTDVYAYLSYGYDVVVSHVSPYAGVAAHDSAAQLQLYRLLERAGPGIREANYGPLFVLYCAIASALSNGSLLAGVVALRVMNAALALAAAFLVGASVPKPASRRAFAAVALHPLVLFESVAFAHGDMLMIALLCASYYFYRRGAYASCAICIVLGGEVRSIALLALVVLALNLSDGRKWSELARATLVAGAAFAITATAAYAVFGRFSLGGAPSLDPYGNPLILAFDLRAPSLGAARTGGAIEAVVFTALAVMAIFRRKPAWSAPLMLAALPVLRSWYVQWLIPVAEVTGGRERCVMNVLAAVAILAELPQMTGGFDAAASAAVLAVIWGVPLAAYAFGGKPKSR